MITLPLMLALGNIFGASSHEVTANANNKFDKHYLCEAELHLGDI